MDSALLIILEIRYMSVVATIKPGYGMSLLIKIDMQTCWT